MEEVVPNLSFTGITVLSSQMEDKLGKDRELSSISVRSFEMSRL